VTAGGQDPRRLAGVAELRRAERPFERPLVGREVPLGLRVAPQAEQRVASLPRTPERQVSADGPLEPVVVVPSFGLGRAQELPVEPKRFPRAPGPQRAFGALAV
jgi:hypothetical protein